MKIYETHFNVDTKEVTRDSVVSEYGSLSRVIEDNPQRQVISRSARLVIFQGGLAFSDYPFYTGEATPAGKGI